MRTPSILFFSKSSQNSVHKREVLLYLMSFGHMVLFYRHRQRYRHLMSLTTPTNPEATPTSRVSTSSWRGSETFLHHPPLITSPTSSHPPSRTPPSHPHSSQAPHTPMESAGIEWGLENSPILFHKSGMEPRQKLEWNEDSDNVFPENLVMTSSPGNLSGFHGDEAITASPLGVKRENPYSSSRLARGRSYSAVVPGYRQRNHSGRGHGSSESGRGLPGVGVALPGSPIRYRASCELHK